MATAEDQLTELMRLSEGERTRIALALLDSLGGIDPYEGMSPEEFRAEMVRRAEEAYEHPSDSMSWDEVRASIVSSRQK